MSNLGDQMDTNHDRILDEKELARFLGDKNLENLSMRPGIIEDVKKKVNDKFPTLEARQEFLQTLAEFEEEMSRLEAEKTARERQNIEWAKKQIVALKNIIQSEIGSAQTPSPIEKGGKPSEKDKTLGTNFETFSGRRSYKGNDNDPMRQQPKASWQDPERTKRQKIDSYKATEIKDGFIKQIKSIDPSIKTNHIDDINVLSACQIITQRVKNNEPLLGDNKKAWKENGYQPDGFFGNSEKEGLSQLESMYRNNTYPALNKHMDNLVGIVSKPEGVVIKAKNMSEFAKSIEQNTMAEGIEVNFENGLLKFSQKDGKDIARVIRFRLQNPEINLSQIKYENGVLYVGKMSHLPMLFLRGKEEGTQAGRTYKDEIILGGTELEMTRELNRSDYRKTTGNNPTAWGENNRNVRKEEITTSKLDIVDKKNFTFEGLLNAHSRTIRHITWPKANSRYYGQFKSALSIGNMEGAKSGAVTLLEKAKLHDLSKILKQETDNSKLAYLCAQLADAMMADSLSERAFAGEISAKTVILEAKRLRAFHSYTSSQGIDLNTPIHELAGKFGGPHKIPVYKDASLIALTFSSRLNEERKVSYRGFDIMPPGVATMAGGHEASITDIKAKRYSTERIYKTPYFENIVRGVEEITGHKFSQQDKEALKEHIIDNSKPLNIGGKQITLDVDHILFAYGRCLNPSMGIRIKGIKTGGSAGMGEIAFNEYGLLIKSRYVKQVIPDVNDNGPMSGSGRGGGGNDSDNGGDNGGGNDCAGNASAGGTSAGGSGGGK